MFYPISILSVEGITFLYCRWIFSDDYFFYSYVQQQGDTSEIAEGCQILRLNNERFTVPEILFYPSDIGMESMGIAETIVKCIRLCPPKDQPLLAKNIVVMGGNANFPGFKERVYSDVRSYLPDHWNVNVYKPEK